MSKNPQQVWKLVYASESHHQLNMQEIHDLLSVSRKNNKRSGITGKLIYCYMNFIQVLEGDKDKVSETFEKINSDPRHKAVTTLAEFYGNREFDGWDMEFTALEDPRFFAEFIKNITSLVDGLDKNADSLENFEIKKFIDPIESKYH